MNKRKQKIGRKTVILIVVLIVALVAAIAGTITAYAYTDGFKTTSPAAVYYADCVYTSEGNVSLPREGDARFIVGGTGFGDDEKKFTVSIKPNAASDFYFIAGDKLQSFKDVKNLASVFDIEYSRNAFTVHCELSKYTPKNVLKALCGDVEIISELPTNLYYFDFSIEVEGHQPITLHIRQLLREKVDGIDGLPPEIIY